MRAALVIARRIVRQRLRDRSALLFAVVTPLGLAIAFSMLIGGATQDFHADYVVVDRDGSELAQVLTRDVLGGLVESGIADVRPVTTEDEARAAVAAGDAGAAIVILTGLYLFQRERVTARAPAVAMTSEATPQR